MKKKTTIAPRSIRRMFPNVTTVIDAQKPVTVHVQKRDCQDATPLDSNHCAMARAAMREFKVDHAVIGIASSYLIKGTKAIRFKTPIAVQREMVSFDRHHDFEPGTYRLTTVSPAVRFGSRVSGTHKTSRDSHAPKRHHTAKIRAFL